MTQLLTRDGTALSPLTFGTMQFGGDADATASRAMFDAARAAGINHFDTAVGYTGGASERLIGPMIAADRDALYLATKVAYAGGAGRANILSMFDTCRSQLGLDSVDLLYLHRFDPDTPLSETFETMARLQSDGAIRHIGVSNYAAWQVMKAQAICATLGTRIDVIQPMYNLVKRQAEVEILPMAADQDILACTYSPLGGGLLTGKYARGENGRLRTNDMYAARYGRDWMHSAATAMTDIARDVGTHPATLAVAWVARHATRPSPIVSGKSVGQLAPSLDANTYTMSDALYDRITALSPTPPPATDRLEEAT
ncbi:aldo/keto reductase [Loktanella sp. SALINAS62]|uniref:aldo/keto reductase n=1 Tax=Loktanella sp. SALINAS62 TaxID=2706124 RepID=UPI001B8BC1F6|nr:aldo/keto reductase [Loktanella sp. SALINAS62]MBS1301241.1 aldo/keto reductase [Loktanella sp. SALINAS62]